MISETRSQRINMKKNFLFACNFKMNSVELKDYQNAMKSGTFSNVLLCPNFCDIKEFCALKNSNSVLIGAQNVSEFESGAHTGEISALMIKNAGADFCIVGHSERKQNNFETLSQINNKIKRLIECGVTPIVCTGEDIFKNAEFASKFVLSELNEMLNGVDISKVIVAYEPVWAIGSGKVPSTEHIETVIGAIKKYAGAEFVLYGGSFNESNFKEIVNIECVDGALIGGASLKPLNIVEMATRLS